MGRNVMDVLKERGFIKQVVFEDELYKKLGSEKVTFYIGFDPTADSLHIGHFLTLMAMAHMQRAGHRPIALIGGGTAHVGDPTGRTDMRQMMTTETIMHNCECFKKQMSRFIDFSEGKALMVNNADWLLNLNYIDFLRDIGSCFSVNKMLTAECFKARMEKGLSFLEFNYMLMQGYDYLELYKKYNCQLELGGDDQWSNMLAGADLIRKKEGKDVFAMTFTLLLKHDGTKMGKTAGGAVWLDKEKTSPYEFYQYFRNIDDQDVEKCFKLLTFVELNEIEELCKYKDERINAAKARLAFEITKIVHGEEEARKAEEQVKAAFTGDASNMEAKEVSSRKILDLLVEVGIASSKGEGRRLIEGGGISIDDDKVTDVNLEINKPEVVIHKGKKVHIKVRIK